MLSYIFLVIISFYFLPIHFVASQDNSNSIANETVSRNNDNDNNIAPQVTTILAPSISSTFYTPVSSTPLSSPITFLFTRSSINNDMDLFDSSSVSNTHTTSVSTTLSTSLRDPSSLSTIASVQNSVLSNIQTSDSSVTVSISSLSSSTTQAYTSSSTTLSTSNYPVTSSSNFMSSTTLPSSSTLSPSSSLFSSSSLVEAISSLSLTSSSFSQISSSSSSSTIITLSSSSSNFILSSSSSSSIPSSSSITFIQSTSSFSTSISSLTTTSSSSSSSTSSTSQFSSFSFYSESSTTGRSTSTLSRRSVTTTSSTTQISDSYLSSGITITSIIQGVTILSNHYTTITLSPTVSSNAHSNLNRSSNHGLSKKNKKIVLGCCLGIGIPVFLVFLCLIYYFFIRQRKESYINSDGQIVTTFKANPLLQLWNQIIGKHSDTNIITSSLSNKNKRLSKSNANSKRSSTIDEISNADINNHAHHHLTGSPLNQSDEFYHSSMSDDDAFEISLSDSSDNNNNYNNLNEKRASSNSDPLNNHTMFSDESLPDNMYTRFIERFDNGSYNGSDNIPNNDNDNDNHDAYYFGENDDEDDEDYSSHRVLNVTNY